MPGSNSLILFRHAKSDWDSVYQSDHGRPLADRGIKAARQMGTILADSGRLPDLIICSTATRARQTLDLARTSGNWNCDVQFSDDLYETTASNLIALLRQVSNSVNSLMLVGHEPTWSSLTSILIGGGKLRFPTAAVARIDFYNNDWSSVDVNSGQLRWLLQPKFFSS